MLNIEKWLESLEASIEVRAPRRGLCRWSCRFWTCLTVFQGVSSDIWLVRVVTWRGRRGWAFKALSLLLCGIEVICGITGKFEPCQGGANCWPIRFPVNKKKEARVEKFKSSERTPMLSVKTLSLKKYIYCSQINSRFFWYVDVYLSKTTQNWQNKPNKHLLSRPVSLWKSRKYYKEKIMRLCTVEIPNEQ